MRAELLSVILFLGCGQAVCGDEVLSEGEACDDGNAINDDGCLADCSLPACGDGFFDQTGELCFEQQTISTSDGAAQGVGPVSIAAVDFNGDGALDLVTGNAQSSDLTILLNDGAGNFGAPSFTATFDEPFSLVVQDFGDTPTPDVLLVSLASDNVSLYTSGTILVGIPTSVLGGPIVASPILLQNNDGFVVLSAQANLARIFTVDNNLAIADNQPELFLDTGQVPSALVASDIDGDTEEDILIAHQGQNVIKLFTAVGDGSFEDAVDVATAGGATGLLAEDLDGDGGLELAITNSTQQSIDLFKRDANQNFQPLAQLPAGNLPAKPVFVDFDGDGLKDLALTNEALSVSILRGNGDGTFQGRLIFNTVNAADFIAADLNQDGKPELITLDEGASLIRVLRSTD